jgi:hypothetical protein
MFDSNRPSYAAKRLDRPSSPDQYNAWLATVGTNFGIFAAEVSRAAAQLNGYGSIYLEKFKTLANHVESLIKQASDAYSQGRIEDGDLIKKEVHQIVGSLRDSSKEAVLDMLLSSIKNEIKEGVQGIILKSL